MKASYMIEWEQGHKSMTEVNRSFYSKVLLFGEYSIIKDSMALATPYPLFEGKLTFYTDGKVDQELKSFAEYLRHLPHHSEEDWGAVDFDFSSFEQEVAAGLFFDSSIPQGYGVGSSGAVVAAIFERYAKNAKDIAQDIFRLKKIFAIMESHFHGSSSGIDPLITFLNTPMLIKDKSNMGPTSLPKFKQGEGALFIINTARPRKTEPLVNLFLEKCRHDEFNHLLHNVLTPITNGCINSFLAGDTITLYERFRELSDFQYRHFQPMIPKLYRTLWREGLKNEEYYLKLCGAGGGGFLLGMTKNYKKASAKLASHEVRSLFSL